MTLNREKLLNAIKQADGVGSVRLLTTNNAGEEVCTYVAERFAALVLSAAQEEREPVAWMWEYIGKDPMAHLLRPCARSFHEMDPHNNPHKDHWKPVAPLYLAPFSSNQACNAAMLEQWDAAYTAFTGAFDTPVARRNLTDEYCSDARRRMRDFDESIRSLKRPLQAQEPASPAAQSGAVDEPTTDDLPPLPAMAMTITDEPGKGHYYSANQMREYARLSRAQAAPDEVQAAEATLYRDLTGDAMAMGYDGIPAALEALRAQAAQQAQPVSDEQIDAAAHHLQEIIAQNGGSPSECAHDHIRDLCALLSQSAAPNEWKRAVDDELVTLQSTADSYATPKDAVRALIDWHVAVERDPKVSEQPAAQMAVPEGWKLVPIYPTAEMIHRGKHAPPYRAIDVYHAMLAAAPLENEMNKASSEASPQGGGK